MISRSAIRLAFQTHYVGDVRAVNLPFLDTYQLKSLDGAAELDLALVGFRRTSGGQVEAYLSGDSSSTLSETYYDRVVSCLGFSFDATPFQTHNVNILMQPAGEKFPVMTAQYESTTVPRLYFAGVASHARDYRKVCQCCSSFITRVGATGVFIGIFGGCPPIVLIN